MGRRRKFGLQVIAVLQAPPPPLQTSKLGKRGQDHVNARAANVWPVLRSTKVHSLIYTVPCTSMTSLRQNLVIQAFVCAFWRDRFAFEMVLSSITSRLGGFAMSVWKTQQVGIVAATLLSLSQSLLLVTFLHMCLLSKCSSRCIHDKKPNQSQIYSGMESWKLPTSSGQRR